MINPAQPQTYNEHVTFLQTLVGQLSDLQFQLGAWACETLTAFPTVTCRQLADDINIGYKALNEWVNVNRFWSSDGLPSDLVQRIAALHEERVQNGTIHYSHFRDARRVATHDKTLTRAEQVSHAVQIIEDMLHDTAPYSVLTAQVAATGAGEDFERMHIVWDSQGWDDSWLELGNTIQSQISSLITQDKQWRVVVYEVSGDA
jgi:hypothetical protein